MGGYFCVGANYFNLPCTLGAYFCVGAYSCMGAYFQNYGSQQNSAGSLIFCCAGSELLRDVGWERSIVWCSFCQQLLLLPATYPIRSHCVHWFINHDLNFIPVTLHSIIVLLFNSNLSSKIVNRNVKEFLMLWPWSKRPKNSSGISV